MRGTAYIPSQILNVPARIHHCTYEKVNGVNTAVYTECEDIVWVSAKSYGGKEQVVDGQYTIIDTMTFNTYYRPDIQAQDLIELVETGDKYEILNTPENVEMRGMFMRFEGRRYHG